jgi:hypothetical protein
MRKVVLLQYADTECYSDNLGNVFIKKNNTFFKKNPKNKNGGYLYIRIPSQNKSVRVHSIVAKTCERNIRQVCNGKEGRKQANGYKWRWYNESI